MGDTGAMINMQSLIDDAKCFETVRAMRWPDGVRCPACESPEVTKHGRDDTQPERQRYLCKSCERRFDDLTDTIFAGHHQPLRIWILCLYLMGLNLSNAQIAKELDLNKDDVHQMTSQLRQGIVVQETVTHLKRMRWNVTRSTSWLATKASRMKWQKRALRPTPTTQGHTRTWHARNREAADLRHDRTRW